MLPLIATMVDQVNLFPGGTLDTSLLNATVNALVDRVQTNAASMDVFFVLSSGYLVFLMQAVRAELFYFCCEGVERGVRCGAPDGWRRLLGWLDGHRAYCRVRCSCSRRLILLGNVASV